MEPVKFDGCNVTFAKDQPEYLPLPGHLDHLSVEGVFISCWQFTFIERLKFLFSGKLFVSILTFHKPLQPIMFFLSNPLKSYGKRI